MMITYRQGSNKGGNSHGEEAKSKRDGHIFRNHLTHENRYDFEHQTRPDQTALVVQTLIRGTVLHQKAPYVKPKTAE